MLQVLAGFLYFVSGALLVLGGITAAQIHAPLWQKLLMFLVIAAIASAIFWVARRIRQGG
ncbi:MAG: hypothetical protein KJ698_01280 [Actinobacteria bacterium]|nr:hypothetical protein [Actinomycetota bacterium]MBU1493578.1 hypothetical protein [Actinomycetota bacterium]MBU1866556.1 hypothetical protein [Actinomycetota bacterium]